jgi:hypothetical protein
MSFINPTQTIADLGNAIEYLDTHGWTQGLDFDGKGGCCAFGAVRGAVGDDNSEFTSVLTRDRCSNVARAFYRVIGVEMTTFNDMQGRTKAQVINAMQTVIQALREDPRRA